MLGTVLLSFLAALGIVLLVFCVLGALWLPPAGNGCCVIYVASAKDCRAVRGQLFLLRCGLSRLPLSVVDCGLPQADGAFLRELLCACPQARYYTAGQWREYRETECHTGVSGT